MKKENNEVIRGIVLSIVAFIVSIYKFFTDETRVAYILFIVALFTILYTFVLSKRVLRKQEAINQYKRPEFIPSNLIEMLLKDYYTDHLEEKIQTRLNKDYELNFDFKEYYKAIELKTDEYELIIDIDQVITYQIEFDKIITAKIDLKYDETKEHILSTDYLFDTINKDEELKIVFNPIDKDDIYIQLSDFINTKTNQIDEILNLIKY